MTQFKHPLVRSDVVQGPSWPHRITYEYLDQNLELGLDRRLTFATQKGASSLMQFLIGLPVLKRGRERYGHWTHPIGLSL